jgi:D-arabinose 1-dehydrogenase-like Zn-dependent alcohol dehydrogenase
LAIQFANKFGYNVVGISRGGDKEKFARELGAHNYIDASKVDPGEALQKMGGAALIVTTAPNGEVMPSLLKGLGILRKLLILSGKSSQPSLSTHGSALANMAVKVPGDVPFNTGVMVSFLPFRYTSDHTTDF